MELFEGVRVGSVFASMIRVPCVLTVFQLKENFQSRWLPRFDDISKYVHTIYPLECK